MAFEALCVNSQKCNKLCGDNKFHDEVDNVECQSKFSCLYETHKKSAREEIIGPSCYCDRCPEQKPPMTNTISSCNLKPTKTDIVPGTITDNTISNLGDAVNSNVNARQQKAGTLHDLYTKEYDNNDDDDDDSDWEPAEHITIKEWCCTNCTIPNFGVGFNCVGCGEHKDSEFSRRCFSLAQISVESDTVQRNQDSTSKTCTAIGFDERMLLHSEVVKKPLPHPERPDRLRAIADSLATTGILGLIPSKCYLIPAREITQEELQMVHSVDHIEAVQQTSCMLSSYFTSDTYANEHSACAARVAAGLCADLALSIMSGGSKNGFALVRPPGHHAGIKQAMGFCLHNNAAVAVLAAQRAGAKKVLIVDWDVHHGNGTQEIFEGNKSVLYISLHRHEDGRFYPGTGAADEVGILDAKGYSVNIPWSCGGVGDNDYISAFQHIVLPIATDFSPDITIISAGFDAARGDPLGCCDVTPAGFAQMTHMLTTLSQGKLLVILEGGYNLRSISSSATAVVKVLLGENPDFDVVNVMPSRAGLQTILQVMKIQRKFWLILNPIYLDLRPQWDNSRDRTKKRKRFIGPLWWKWGSKRFVYELLYGRRSKGRRH